MRLRELLSPRRQAAPASEAPADQADADRLRGSAEELLRAGDEAIRRALSGDSEGFLRANRQSGGE
jgi:hypothetical protein